MSGEVPLPAIEGIQSCEFDIEDNIDAPTSVLSKTIQRQVRSGARWRGGLVFPKAQGDEAGVLNGWLRQATRGDRWFWLTPPHAFVRGAWSPADLITNGTLISGVTTGWGASGSTLSVNTRRLKVKNTGAGTGNANQIIAMEPNKPHVLVVDVSRGSATSAQFLVQRVSDAVNEANSGAVAANARVVLLVTPTVASMRLLMIVNEAVAARDIHFSGISLTRCLQVAGAGQAGNRLNVDGGPASMNAALKAGEFVCFLVGTRYQLVQLVEDLDTDAAGAGTLVFEPTLRGSPADNAAVIVRYPFGRFIIPEPAPVTLSAGDGGPFHGFACSVLEDITP